jgi:hypothetical protein
MNIAMYGLIGAIIGAIPALLGVVAPWLRDRDRVSTEKRRIELAKAEVEFISAWLDAVEKAPGDNVKTIKLLALDRLSQLFDSNTQNVFQDSAAPQGANDIKSSRLKRGAFFVYLGFYCFMILGMSTDDSKNPSFSTLLKDIRSDGGFTLILFSIPLIWLFIRSRRPVKRHGGSSSL